MDLQIGKASWKKEGDHDKRGVEGKLSCGVVKVGFPLGLETKRVEGQRLISPPHPFPAGGIGGRI